LSHSPGGADKRKSPTTGAIDPPGVPGPHRAAPSRARSPLMGGRGRSRKLTDSAQPLARTTPGAGRIPCRAGATGRPGSNSLLSRAAGAIAISRSVSPGAAGCRDGARPVCRHTRTFRPNELVAEGHARTLPPAPSEVRDLRAANCWVDDVLNWCAALEADFAQSRGRQAPLEGLAKQRCRGPEHGRLAVQVQEAGPTSPRLAKVGAGKGRQQPPLPAAPCVLSSTRPPEDACCTAVPHPVAKVSQLATGEGEGLLWGQA